MASTGFGPDFYNIVLKKSQDSLGDFSTFLEQTGRRIQNGQPSPSLTQKSFYGSQPQTGTLGFGGPVSDALSQFASPTGFQPLTQGFDWSKSGIPTPNTKVEPPQGGSSQHGPGTARPSVTVPQGAGVNTGQKGDGNGFSTSYGRDLAPQQFGDPTLPFADAVAACGPVAAIAFLRETGRNMTLSEATAIAREKGVWDQSTGMHGPEAEQKLLSEMGVNATLAYSPIEQDVINAVENGRAVILSSPGDYHYYVVTDWNPDTGEFYVGNTGNVWRDPNKNASWKDWTSLGPQAALFFDPGAASDELASSNGVQEQDQNQAQDQSGDPRSTIVDMARQTGGDEFAQVINGVLTLEDGLTGKRSSLGAVGPFQFLPDRGRLVDFANSLGVSQEDAMVIAEHDPAAVAQFAFTYLKPVYDEGKTLGLSGPDLLLYVQLHGQVSETPSHERVMQAWES